MKETIVRVVMWCDFHGKETEAVNTLIVGLNGKEREVDVCPECDLMLSEPFGRALVVGRKPTPVSERQPKRQRHYSAPRKGIIDHRKALRDFADANNLRNPKHPELMMYEYPSGSFAYPQQLEDLYTEAQRNGFTVREKEAVNG